VSGAGLMVSGFGFRVRLENRTPLLYMQNITMEDSSFRRDLAHFCWEGYHESRRCSRETYPESYITK